MTRSLRRMFRPLGFFSPGPGRPRRKVRRALAVDGLEPRRLLSATASAPAHAAHVHSLVAPSYKITFVNETNARIKVSPTGHPEHVLSPGQTYAYDAYSFAVRLENLQNHKTYGPRGLSHTTYFIRLTNAGAPYLS